MKTKKLRKKEKNNFKNVWTWETCVFTLSHPSGKTIQLNSGDINDFTLGHIREDLEKYIKETYNGSIE
jgi:hypothetical protein